MRGTCEGGTCEVGVNIGVNIFARGFAGFAVGEEELVRVARVLRLVLAGEGGGPGSRSAAVGGGGAVLEEGGGGAEEVGPVPGERAGVVGEAGVGEEGGGR